MSLKKEKNCNMTLRDNVNVIFKSKQIYICKKRQARAYDKLHTQFLQLITHAKVFLFSAESTSG